MKTIPPNLRSGFSLGKLVVASLVVLIVALLVILVRRFTVWGDGSRAAAGGSIGYTASRVIRVVQLINHRASATSVVRKIEDDPWSAARLRGAFGLYLVEAAAYYDRPRLLKMLLSRHTPVNGNGNYLPPSR